MYAGEKSAIKTFKDLTCSKLRFTESCFIHTVIPAFSFEE